MGPITEGGRGEESKAKPTAAGAIYVPHNTKIRCVNSRQPSKQRSQASIPRQCAVKLRTRKYILALTFMIKRKQGQLEYLLFKLH